jgi:hypothetical protein
MTEAAALEWSFRPWRDARRTSVLALMMVLGGVALVVWLVEPGLTRLALALAVAASFADAFLPVECRLAADGVHRRTPLGAQHRPWTDVRRARIGPRAVVLSPFTRRTWLETFRALVLPFPPRADGLSERARELLRAHGL